MDGTIPATDGGPVNAFRKAEMLEWLERFASQSLSKTELQVLQLYYFEGCDDAEAAEALDVTPEAAGEIRRVALEKIAEAARQQITESGAESKPRPPNLEALKVLREWEQSEPHHDEAYWDDLKRDVMESRIRFRDVFKS